MTSKPAYRLSNGIVLETEPELKAYIRGLEIARATSESCTGGREEFLSKVGAALEEAQVSKNAGLTDEAAPAAAEEVKPAEAEKAVDAEKAAE